jgi:hypothetical protein
MKSSIDKFGGYIGYASRENLKVGPPGKGFKLTPLGDYDMENKRLTNIGDCIDSKDAVTKNYILETCPVFEEKQVNLRKRKITNVGDPETETDVVNKGYFDKETDKNFNKCVKFNPEKKIIDCQKYAVTNILNPSKSSDAVSLEFLQNNTLFIKNDKFNAKKLKIINLKDPEHLQDAVTKQYVEKFITSEISKKCVVFEEANEVNLKNYNLKNVKILKEPVNNFDVSNKHYVDEKLMKLERSINEKLVLFIKPENGNIDFKGYIVSINDPINESSPISLKQVRNILQNYIFVNEHGEIHMHNATVKNLNKPKEKYDATNKEYVDRVVRQNNTTIVEVVLKDLIKDFVKPDENGVINLDSKNIKLVLKGSDDENSPVLNYQFNAFVKRITSEIDRMNEKIKLHLFPPSISSSGARSDEKPQVDLLSEIKNLKREIDKIKAMKVNDDDDDKDDFWERVDKLNKD